MRHLLLLTLFFAGGCGNLNAQVYMFDRTGFEDYRFVQRNLPSLKALDQALHDKNNRNSSIKQPDVDSLDEATERLSNFVAYIESNNMFSTLNGVLNGSSHLPPVTAYETMRIALAQAIEGLKGDATHRSLAERAQKIMDDASAAADAMSSANGTPANAQAFQDASQYIYAPKQFWIKQANSAQGFGAYGNVDIAIRMRPDPDYSIKGFRVDSSKLIANTVALTRQIVAAVAASYGVPTSLSTSGGSGTRFNLTDDLAQVAGVVASQKAEIAAKHTAEEALLKSIASAADDLSGGDSAKLKVAITHIKDCFDAQRKVLDPTSSRPQSKDNPANTKPAASEMPGTSPR